MIILNSANECPTGPDQKDAADYARCEVEYKCAPVAFAAKYPHVVGERREGSETSAESCDEQGIFARGHYVGAFEQAEQQADDETAYHVYQKCIILIIVESVYVGIIQIISTDSPGLWRQWNSVLVSACSGYE